MNAIEKGQRNCVDTAILQKGGRGRGNCQENER